MAQTFRDNHYIKVVTENPDVDMLRQFKMTDRAKDVSEMVTQFATKAYPPENKGEEMRKQNEQESTRMIPSHPFSK